MKDVITVLILMAIASLMCLIQNWWDGRKNREP